MTEGSTSKIFGFLTLKILIIICAVVAVVVVGAVIVISGWSGSGGGDGSFDYGQNYIDNNLPDSYRIVFSITAYDSNEVISLPLEQIRTLNGYYFDTGVGDGLLFIKNGTIYDLYVLGSDGVYENSGVNFEQSYVENIMSDLWGYMTNYVAYQKSMMKVGSETVAGRACDKYSLTYTQPLYGSVTYSCSIDKATGVCLKWTCDAQASGEKGGYEFVCTNFSTSGISLPTYK
ncbi:MAG: hypothetical protein LBC12_05060 [Nitrososphaerota archaeon]|nr:hypothetical protein [Nitrososphaerota archaeon]